MRTIFFLIVTCTLFVTSCGYYETHYKDSYRPEEYTDIDYTDTEDTETEDADSNEDHEITYEWSYLILDDLGYVGVTWQTANEYCYNLVYNGHDDWRLPTLSELRQLIINCPETETGGECPVSDVCYSAETCLTDSCKGCLSSENKMNGQYSSLGDWDRMWTATFDIFSVYVIDFQHAWIYDGVPGDSYNARCIRVNY